MALEEAVRAELGTVGAVLFLDERHRLVTLDTSTVSRYYSSMIASFRDADTEQLWQTGRSRRIPANLRMGALKKLLLLHASVALDNLSVPPGNRLEALHGQRKGQHSIRINDQYRICFVWREGNARDVEIVDYH
jgi:toxin HigB-1